MFTFKKREQDKNETAQQQAQFRTLCQLCSPNFTREDILATEIDWPVVWKLALRHRVVPVMADRIKLLDLVVPDDIATMMANNVQQNLFNGMKQAAELVRLTHLFEENDIPFVVFKGIALLKLMGLELHQRHHGDIDVLLADVGDIWKVDEYLRQSGYERTCPSESLKLNCKQQEVLLSYVKDVGYWHPEKKIRLEIHHRLCDNIYLFPSDLNAFHKNQSSIKINSTTVPVMAKSGYLLYLLVHGSVSCWSRLKWVCDIALISNNGRDYDSLSLLDTAKALGIERIMMQGLLLSHRLFAIPISNEAKDYPSHNRLVSTLVDYAQSSMHGSEPGQNDSIGLSTKFQTLVSKRISYELKLRDGPMYKIQQLRRYLTYHLDWEDLQLPSKLFFLYYPLRPIFWLRRHFF